MPLNIFPLQNLDILRQSGVQFRDEPQFALANAISTGLALPGLVAYYSMASFDRGNGDVFDISGASRTLTNNNTVTFGYDGLIPYANLVSASSQSISRSDEAGLDIIGTGSYTEIGFEGLTIGGWVNFNSLNDTQSIVAKWSTIGNQRSVWLYYYTVTGSTTFSISTSGGSATVSTVSSVIPTVVQNWYFVSVRFLSGSKIDIILWDKDTKHSSDGIVSASTAAVTLHNSTSSLEIGSVNNGNANHLDGKCSNMFISSVYLSDTILFNLFNQQRSLYGV